MSIAVAAPGLLTTVQDLGRGGYRHLGVGAAGALDAYSHAIANLLAGNRVGAATLEITLAGPRLRFQHATRIAICGAAIDARVIDARGDDIALPSWRTAWVPANATLALGACRRGTRAYLAIGGGFVVPPVLGSASTDLRGGFGGHAGRALVAGDVLTTWQSHVPFDVVRIAPWWIDPTPDVDFASPTVIRVTVGADETAPGDELFAREWQVAGASDRQGLRLDGEPLRAAVARERVSEPVAPGTIQLPPDGRPIVLLADAQTHGGYPRIGHAIRADWPRLAQLRPGDALRFVPCTPIEADRLWREQARRLARIAIAIAGRTTDQHGVAPVRVNP